MTKIWEKKNIEHTQQQKTHEFLVFQYFCGISKLSWLWLSSFILDQPKKKNAKKSPRFRDRYRASLRGCQHGTWCKGVHHRLTEEAHDAGTAHHHRATGRQVWHGHRLPLKRRRNIDLPSCSCSVVIPYHHWIIISGIWNNILSSQKKGLQY